ncbi:MAG: hypothetical protein KTR35_09815 [Gammaproteobacteria bacterium]|nr:hypothetical protein [Gammaproteobacteria bacterium]
MKPSVFYQFLGAHSLLIGLFPFYLPVYLWGLGFNLQAISVLIGISGATFCLSLKLWQTIARHQSAALLVALTFGLECLLVIAVFLLTEVLKSQYIIAIACLLGIANGLYNAFFWTTQRTLFLALLGSNDSGRQFGNFQIFVTLFLKFGIVLGGLLLEQGGLLWIIGLSTVLNLSLWIWFKRTLDSTRLSNVDSCTFAQGFTFKDNRGSALSFRIDGIFLFLESHFWTLTLFILVKSDYAALGLVVVALAAVFALLFFLIKNTIDLYPTQQIYLLAVALYVLSWVLRYSIDTSESVLESNWLGIQLIVITFCTSFFRLAFNKRFFDHAKSGTGVHYLLAKSIVSQAYLSAFFLALALYVGGFAIDGVAALQASYLLAAVVAILFAFYQPTVQPARGQS